MDPQMKGQPMSTAATQSAPANVLPLPLEVAAAANLTPEFVLMLGTLGFEILVVRFQALHDSPIWEHEGIERELQMDLQTIGAGHLDASCPTPGALWHFFHVSDLVKALAAIKARLAALGLLDVATLIHAATAQDLRVCWPVPASPATPNRTA
ncbi:MAG: hypothetical protein WCS42_08140 [Verrucomicrobiota bacterium]